MNGRREPPRRRKRPLTSPDGPAGLSWATWRQLISLALLAVLALTGLAVVAMRASGPVPAVVLGILLVSGVVALGLSRAGR
jgi:hypothetical protein